MGFQVNGVDVTGVNLDGVPVTEVQIDGVKVWPTTGYQFLPQIYTSSPLLIGWFGSTYGDLDPRTIDVTGNEYNLTSIRANQDTGLLTLNYSPSDDLGGVEIRIDWDGGFVTLPYRSTGIFEVAGGNANNFIAYMQANVDVWVGLDITANNETNTNNANNS